MNHKVLFSNLPWWTTGDQGERRHGVRAGSRWPFTQVAGYAPDNYRFGAYCPTPFFLNSAAAWLQATIPVATVTIRDSIARGESYESFFAYVRSNTPDWLVVESATPCKEHDLRVISALKAAHPDLRVILTGTIVADCKFTLPPGIEAAIKGEYEKGVVSVIRDGARGIIEFDLLTVEEMNQMPYPMMDRDAAYNYADGCPLGQIFPHLQVWTSRGCPFRCCFCIWPAAMTGNDPDGTKPRKVRCHSPEWLEGMLRNRLAIAEAAGRPYRCIYLDDDTANLVEKHTIAVCAVMKRIGLPWSAMCRGDTISRETWQLMRDSGCFGVKLGFESGVQRVVDQIVNKRLSLDECRGTALFLRSIGMSVHGTFTIGMPGETEEEQKKTIEFIQDLYRGGCIDSHQLSGTAVIEGTPLATLLAGGVDLPKYPGMHYTPEFRVETDGQAKAEHLMHAAKS